MTKVFTLQTIEPIADFHLMSQLKPPFKRPQLTSVPSGLDLSS